MTRAQSQEPDLWVDEVRIRRAITDDAEGICAAHLASIRGVCAKDYTPEQIESWCLGKVPEIYTPLIQRHIWYVAQDPKGVAGFGEIDPGPETGAQTGAQSGAETGDAEIRALYLAPRVVGRGVGAAILTRLLAHARAAGARRAFLKGTVTAEPFYKRLGFTTTHRTTHTSRGGLDLPCVAMELDLTKTGHRR